ncbi:calphotin-like [Scaptodrosophila lebanonensis]|uniref:Calphotin-like n=1 Tax=Drosophila lebanonensis TaxID=7225 RepID=A0A6J2U2U2_DROLE|nr:calphotin-like [Scaptodrosophila lebanonensis]
MSDSEVSRMDSISQEYADSSVSTKESDNSLRSRKKRGKKKKREQLSTSEDEARIKKLILMARDSESSTASAGPDAVARVSKAAETDASTTADGPAVTIAAVPAEKAAVLAAANSDASAATVAALPAVKTAEKAAVTAHSVASVPAATVVAGTTAAAKIAPTIAAGIAATLDTAIMPPPSTAIKTTVHAVPRCSAESIVAGGSSAIIAELSVMARMEPEAAIPIFDAVANATTCCTKLGRPKSSCRRTTGPEATDVILGNKSNSTTPKPKRSPKGPALVTSNVLLRAAKGTPNSSSPKEDIGKNEPASSTPKSGFRPVINSTTVVRWSGDFHAPVQPYNPTVSEAANSGSNTASLYKRATAPHTSPKTRTIRSSAVVRRTSASARAAQHDNLRPDVQDQSRSDLIELESNEEDLDSDSSHMVGASALPASPPNQHNASQNDVAEPIPLQSDDLENQDTMIDSDLMKISWYEDYFVQEDHFL